MNYMNYNGRPGPLNEHDYYSTGDGSDRNVSQNVPGMQVLEENHPSGLQVVVLF